MADELDVSCPKCGTVFTVPGELCGEMAECSECASVFEIPFPEETKALESTETGAIKGVEAKAEEVVDTTNTVKLSRTGIGMIPTLKESFEFGTKVPGAPQGGPKLPTMQLPSSQAPAMQKPSFQFPPSSPPQQPAAPQQPAMQQTAPTMKKPVFTKPPSPGAPGQAPLPTAAQTGTSKTQAPSTPAIQIKVPEWAKVIIHKDEEIYACSEDKINPYGIASLVSLPALICIVMPLIVPFWAAAVAAAIIAVATFVTAAIMISKSGKKLVILTSQRAISVTGNKKLEAKK